jgi:hypothetical protein
VYATYLFKQIMLDLPKDGNGLVKINKMTSELEQTYDKRCINKTQLNKLEHAQVATQFL